MKSVLLLGDSISLHYSPYLEQYLGGLMSFERVAGTEEALRNLDLPQGANLGSSSRVLDYLKARLAKALPISQDYLLLNCGLHDIRTDPATGGKLVPLKDYGENLREIIATVRTLGPRLLWMRTTPCDEAVHNAREAAFHRFAADVRAYNEAADAIMAKHGVTVVDLHTFTSNLGPDLYCDHVHLHPHIREKQGAFLAGFLLGLG